MAKKELKKKPVKRKKKTKKQTTKAPIRNILLVAFFACLALGIYLLVQGGKYAVEDVAKDKYMVKGVDVSHHNSIINWGILLEKHISFVYIKATEGTTHTDKTYAINYELAKGTNIKVGAYHFYSFGVSGLDQATHFIQNTKHGIGDLIPAIDVEHSRSNKYSKDSLLFTNTIRELKVLENELYEHFGVHPLIYTNRNCYELYIEENFPNNYIWMSDLDKEPSDKINWLIWQYSHSGEMDGIEGKIDLNYYRYGFDEFKELLLP